MQEENNLVSENDDEMEKADYITTPFPYAYAAPHIGNLYQIIRADVLAKARNSYYRAHLCDRKTYAPYRGLHLTGLPIGLKISELNTDLKASDFESVFNKHQIGYLYDADTVKNIKQLDLTVWYALIKKYYGKLLTDMNVDNSTQHHALNEWYSTTPVDPHYDEFLNTIYAALDARNLLVEGFNYVIHCKHCNNIVGDHDRKNYDGHGVLQMQIKSACVDGTNTRFYLDQKTERYYAIAEKKYMAADVFERMKNNLPAKCSVNAIFVTEDAEVEGFNLNSEGLKTQVLKPQPALADVEKRSELYYSVGDICCRCGATAVLKSESTMFINFECNKWKSAVYDALETAPFDLELKETLKKALSELRKVAFLRTAGYGSTLSVLAHTKYKNHMVDSLTDSMLFPYYAYDRHILDSSRSLKNSRILLHSSGKDLIKNHLLYFLCMSVLLLPHQQLPTLIADAHIVDENNNKMSKSLNNVITYEDLKQLDLADRSTLITCITNMADGNENRKLILRNLKQLNRSEQKKAAEMLSLLNLMGDAHLQADQDLKSLIYVIARELKIELTDANVCQTAYFKNEKYERYSERPPYKYFRLRQIKHLVYHQIYQVLKKIPVTAEIKKTDLKFSIRQLLLNLIKSLI